MNKGQFLPSPHKKNGVSVLRSPSPTNQSKGDGQSFAALKSSLTMMCSRQNESKTPQPIEAWAQEATRNKRTPHKQTAGSSTTMTQNPLKKAERPVQKHVMSIDDTSEFATKSKKEYDNFLDSGIASEISYTSSQKKGPTQNQFYTSQHRKLVGREKKSNTPDLLSKSQISHKRNDSNIKPPLFQPQRGPGQKPPMKMQERPKTPTLCKVETRNTVQERASHLSQANKSRPASKKEVGRTFHEYEDNDEDYHKTFQVVASKICGDTVKDSAIDMKKVFAFLHSPPSSRDKKTEATNQSAENKNLRVSTKGKGSEKLIPSPGQQSAQGRSERSVPTVFMKRTKANNIVTHARTLTGHRNTVTCFCIAEGNLWSGSKDRAVLIWDYASQQNNSSIATVKAHNGGITNLCPIPMSGLVATGSEDQHMSLWSVHDRSKLGSFKCKNSVVECIVAKDSTQIISGHSDHSIKVCVDKEATQNRCTI